MPLNFADGSRLKKSITFAAVGLLVNFFLGISKVFIGWQSGFISIIGDGFNNITDMGAVILLMMTFYYSAKPSNTTHPFGLGRLEYINTTVMAAVILYVGITLLIESVQKIFSPEEVSFSPVVIAVLLLGIVCKLFLAWWYTKGGKVTGSGAFAAYGADSLSDLWSTSGVLISTLVQHFSGWHTDGYVGAAMSLYILWTGWKIMRNAVNLILGAKPDSKIYSKIKQCILECPGVYGVHDLIVHDYGPENHFATAHVELDSSLSLVEGHELSENVMTTLREKLHVQAVIHADPKAVTNPREAQYRTDLEAAIYRSKIPVTYHDFFVEESEDRINLSFELTMSSKFDKSDEEIYRILSAQLQEINPKYHAEMLIDRNFISGKVYGVDKKEAQRRLDDILQKSDSEKDYREQ